MDKFTITVNGKFVTPSGQLSDEYPDACLFTSHKRALWAAERVCMEPKFEGAQVTIHENYGMESSSEYEVN